MQLKLTIALCALSAFAAAQTTSDPFNNIPIPTDVGCGGTVELDSTTIIGSCSGSTASTTNMKTTTTSSPGHQQSGNGGIVDGSMTVGGNGGSTTTSSPSAGGAAKATGLSLAMVALGGAGAALVI